MQSGGQGMSAPVREAPLTPTTLYKDKQKSLHMQNPQQKNFEQLAEAVRYYRWFADVVAPWIGKRILDIGCGYGNVTANFLDRSYVHGIDIERSYVDHIRARYSAKANFLADLLDITDPASVAALKPYHFDTAIAFNVLEHIADDVRAARHVHEILDPGGNFVLLVPAFTWLLSPYDKEVGHLRRYTKETAAACMRRAGFDVVHAQYFNALGVLGWLWTYKLLKKNEPGRGAVRILEALVPLLKRIEKTFSPPLGISVIVVGKK